MKILFVRHGKSQANADGTIGVADTPLAEEGVQQAKAAGDNLRSQNVTAIVCSPYLRTRQTAELIAAQLNIPQASIQIIDELHERGLGELEGKPKMHESAFFYENDRTFGFEPQEDLIKRMAIALDKVKQIAATTNGTTLVVGHATCGFFFLQVAKGRQHFADFDPVNDMGNGEFAEVELT